MDDQEQAINELIALPDAKLAELGNQGHPSARAAYAMRGELARVVADHTRVANFTRWFMRRLGEMRAQTRRTNKETKK